MSDQDLLRGLERATWRVGATTNEADLFALIIEAAADVGYDSASIMVYDRGVDALVVRAAKGEDVLGTMVPSGPAISWRAMERRQPVVVKGPAGRDLPHTYTKDIPYAICLPLLVGAKALGVLNVNRSTEPTESEVGFLRILAYEAAFAVERAGGSVRPATLEDLGLAGAISSAATEIAAEAGWEIEEDIGDIAPLRPDAEAALYRASIEALLNAKRHAGARKVTVKLHEDDAYLEIVVADDGQGFASEQWGEASAKAGHFGLLHMRERIGLLGGVCKIASKPGEGTTVRITVPRDRVS